MECGLAGSGSQAERRKSSAKEPPGLTRNPLQEAAARAQKPCGKKALAKFGEVWEARCRQTIEFPAPSRICGARLILPGRVLLCGYLSRGPRGKGTRARGIPRTAGRLPRLSPGHQAST